MPKTRNRNYTKVNQANAQKRFRIDRQGSTDMEVLQAEANRRQAEKLALIDTEKYGDMAADMVKREGQIKARLTELNKQVIPEDRMDTSAQKGEWLRARIVDLEQQHVNASEMVNNAAAHFTPEEADASVKELDDVLDQLEAALDSTIELLEAQPKKVKASVAAADEADTNHPDHDHEPASVTPIKAGRTTKKAPR